ncbi:MAG: DUF551 domain-containing protein [Nitrosomonadaceae bacterium]
MEWISVDDKMPLEISEADKYESIRVIILYMENYEGENGNGVCVEFYTVGDKPSQWGSWSNHTGNITHWMPLPEPPKE